MKNQGKIRSFTFFLQGKNIVLYINFTVVLSFITTKFGLTAKETE